MPIVNSGCASQKASSDFGVYRVKQKIGEILGTPVIRGQLCTVYKLSSPAVIKAANLGVTDDDIPLELRNPFFVYTLSREGTHIGIAGIFPNRISADRRKSGVIISKRHVDESLESSKPSAAFRITDP